MGTVKNLTDREKDELFKTVVFTEGMGDAYSDSEHLNRVLKSVDTNDVKNPSRRVRFDIFDLYIAQ